MKNVLLAAVAATVLSTGLHTAPVIAEECSEQHRQISRINPSTLSDYQTCLVKKLYPDDESGSFGNLIWVKSGDVITTIQRTELQRQGSSEKAVEYAERAVVEQLIKDEREKHQVKAEDLYKQIEAFRTLQAITEKSYEEEIAILQAQLLAKVNDNAVITAEVSNLKGEVSTLETTISSKNSRITALEGEVSSLEASIVAKNSEIADLELSIADQDGVITGLKGEVEILKVSVSAKDGMITDLEGEVSSLEASIVDKNGVITGLEGEVDSLKVSVSAKDGMITDLESSIVDKNGMITDLEGEVESLKVSVSDKDGVITGLEASIVDKDGVITGLEASIVDKDGMITDLEGEISALETSYGHLSDQHRIAIAASLSLNTELSKINAKLEAAKVEISDLTNQLEAVTAQVEMLQAQTVFDPSVHVALADITADNIRDLASDAFNSALTVLKDNSLSSFTGVNDGKNYGDAPVAVVASDITYTVTTNNVTNAARPASYEDVVIDRRGTSWDAVGVIVYADGYRSAPRYLGGGNAFEHLSDEQLLGNLIGDMLTVTAHGVSTTSITIGDNLIDLTDLNLSKVNEVAEAAYNEGYDDGYSDGYSDGYADGFVDGVNSVM